MSVASLAGYLNSAGGGGGDSTFETVTIEQSENSVELSCVIDDKLNVPGITTQGVDIYNDAGNGRVKLRCINDSVLDVNNLITYTVKLANPNNSNNVSLSCTTDDVLSLPSINVTNGITFPDGKTQTIAYEGGSEAIILKEGVGISIVEDPTNTYTFTNTGGGGGGGSVNGLVAGTGIGIVEAVDEGGDKNGVFTISNGGVLNITKGDGIEVTSEDQDFTVSNTGVLALTAGVGIDITGENADKTITNIGVLKISAGDGITISGGNDDITITNSGGGGGGISSVNSGAGITATTIDGAVELENTGVLDLTAGTGITITGSNANRTINATPTASTSYTFFLNSNGVSFTTGQFQVIFDIPDLPYNANYVYQTSILETSGNGGTLYIHAISNTNVGGYSRLTISTYTTSGTQTASGITLTATIPLAIINHNP